MNEPKKRTLAVLIAEDSEAISSMVALWLRSMGHTVSCAATGKEAIGLLDQTYFDLIITDVLMPDGDGIDVIAEAKKRYPSTRVFVMSGGGNAMNPAQCLQLAASMGAHAAIMKPFTVEQFMDALREAVPPSDTSAPFPGGHAADAGSGRTV